MDKEDCWQKHYPLKAIKVILNAKGLKLSLETVTVIIYNFSCCVMFLLCHVPWGVHVSGEVQLRHLIKWLICHVVLSLWFGMLFWASSNRWSSCLLSSIDIFVSGCSACPNIHVWYFKNCFYYSSLKDVWLVRTFMFDFKVMTVKK